MIAGAEMTAAAAMAAIAEMTLSLKWLYR